MDRIIKYCKTGNLDKLKRLDPEIFNLCTNYDALIRYSNLDIIKYIANVKRDFINVHLFTHACTCGNFAIVEWILNNFSTINVSDIAYGTFLEIFCKHPNIAKYIVQADYDYCTISEFNLICKLLESSDIVSKLKNVDKDIVITVFRIAFGSGKYSLVVSIYNNFEYISESVKNNVLNILDIAASYGHLNIFKWIQTICPATIYHYEIACYNRNMDIVYSMNMDIYSFRNIINTACTTDIYSSLYILENLIVKYPQYSDTVHTMCAVFYTKNLNMIRWFVKEYLKNPDTDNLFKASVTCGHKIREFMENNFGEKYRYSNMEHLLYELIDINEFDAVQCIVSKYDIVIDANKINLQFYKDASLDFIIWLIDKTIKDIMHINAVDLQNIFKYACINSQLSKAKWLHQYVIIPDAEIQHIFENVKCINVAEWLYNSFTINETSKNNLFNNSCYDGNIILSQWLYSIGADVVTDNFKAFTTSFAKFCSSLPTIRWLSTLPEYKYTHFEKNRNYTVNGYIMSDTKIAKWYNIGEINSVNVYCNYDINFKDTIRLYFIGKNKKSANF